MTALRRRPAAAPAVRAPWGWAVAGVLIGAAFMLVTQAPARWLAAGLARATGGMLLLTEPQAVQQKLSRHMAYGLLLFHMFYNGCTVRLGQYRGLQLHQGWQLHSIQGRKPFRQALCVGRREL